MLDDNFRYSLCISYPGKLGKPLLHRVADYDAENFCFKQAYYTDKDMMEAIKIYDPVIIGAIPDELNMYEAVIRKWIPKEDDLTKQWSYIFEDYGGEIYEIIRTPEFSESSGFADSQIRNILKEGITLTEEVGESFLLVVDSKTASKVDSYEVLQCNKSDFIQVEGKYCIPENFQDIIHSKHFFNRYRISEKNIISNLMLNKYLNSYNVRKVRYFYTKTYLEKPIEKFFIRDAENYTIYFFSKYFRQHKDKYQLTKKEIKKLLEIIEQVKKAEDEINDFFEQTGFDYEVAKSAINKYSDEVTQLLVDSADLDIMIQRYLLENENIYAQCVEKVKKEWFEEVDRDREKKENELQKINIDIKNHKNKLDTTKAVIDEHEKILSNVEDKIKEAEKEFYSLVGKKEIIEDDIKERINKFKEDIIRTTELIGVAEAVKDNNSSELPKSNSNKIYIRNAEKLREEGSQLSDIENLEDFSEELSENIALNFNEDIEISTTVLSALINNKAVILSDSLGESIANSVSALVDSTTAEYLFVSLAEDELPVIINQISNTKVKTIYIDGVLNSFDEATFIAICKNCKDKHLFFGVGSKDVVATLTKNIWNYAIYIEIERYVCIPKKGNYTIGFTDIPKIDWQNKQKELSKTYKIIKKFVQKGLMTKKLAIDYTYLLATYHEIIVGDNIGISLLESIYICCNNQSLEIEEYEEKLLACSILEKDLKIITGY